MEIQWQSSNVIKPTLSSLAAPEIVITTTPRCRQGTTTLALQKLLISNVMSWHWTILPSCLFDRYFFQSIIRAVGKLQMTFTSLEFDLYPTWTIAALYGVTYHIGTCYNGTPLVSRFNTTRYDTLLHTIHSSVLCWYSRANLWRSEFITCIHSTRHYKSWLQVNVFEHINIFWNF